MSAKHKADTTEKHTHPSQKKANSSKVFLLVAVLVLLGVAVIIQATSNSSDKKPNTNNTSSNSNGNATLYIKPPNQQVASGTSVTFEVWVDTEDQPVNAVQANLSYPADSFDFNSVDAKGSAFEIQASSTGGEGKVTIARGHVGEVKGKALVAKVILTAKDAKGDAKVEFATGSAVVRSTDHIDILKQKTGSTFKVSKVSGSNAAALLKREV
jgi:flagellar basal body-associated protein FliL